MCVFNLTWTRTSSFFANNSTFGGLLEEFIGWASLRTAPFTSLPPMTISDCGNVTGSGPPTLQKKIILNGGG